MNPERRVDEILAGTREIRAAVLPPFALSDRQLRKLVKAILYSAVEQFPEGQLMLEGNGLDASSERAFAASHVDSELRGVSTAIIRAAAIGEPGLSG